MLKKIFKNPDDKLIQNLFRYEKEFTDLRQYFHKYPELSREEHQTARKIESLLNSWGVQTTRINKTGVVGCIKKGNGVKSIGIRADIDALPISETNTFPYSSTNDHVMHACGHDGHTCMLLMAAKYLALDASFNGAVTFIFQPDEEDTAGANQMIKEGLFEQFPVDCVFALHNYPSAKQGEVLISHGPQMAGTCRIEIDIYSQGGHAAHPYQTSDSVLAASHVVVALQSIVSRNISALDSAVVTIASIHGGSANNIIPSHIKMTGTLRYFDIALRDKIKEKIKIITKQTVSAYGASAKIALIDGYIPTINHKKEVELCTASIQSLINPEYINYQKTPSMGAEDFGFMLNKRPGAYLYIGNDVNNQLIPLHTSNYDFNDQNIIVGSAIWCKLVEDYLI